LERLIKVKADSKMLAFVATVTGISNDFMIGVVCKNRVASYKRKSFRATAVSSHRENKGIIRCELHR
jgi:hypothetical protein